MRQTWASIMGDSRAASVERTTWIWALVVFVVGFFQIPAFIEALWPRQDVLSDFYQDWASARNYLTGLPIYADHRETIPRYVGQVDPLSFSNRVNAHPPSSVLPLILLARLDYRTALLVWNLASLALLGLSLYVVARGVGLLLSVWKVCAGSALLLLCRPLLQQLFHGQWNLLLLALLTGSWAAGRSGRPAWAGTLVGVAAAIKLFPAFLFLYFGLRRQWVALFAGALTLVLLSGFTMMILGAESYRYYVQDVVPRLHKFRTSWFNASLLGFWTKLFDPATREERVEPLYRSAAAARVAILASWLGVLAVLTASVRRAQTRVQFDHAFGVATTGMLLLSPITWDYAFLLLLVPATLLWVDPPRSEAGKLLLILALAGLWFWQKPLCSLMIPGGVSQGVAQPLHTVTVISYPCYSLVVLLLLGASRAVDDRRDPPTPGILSS